MVQMTVRADSKVAVQILFEGAQEVLGTEGLQELKEQSSSGTGADLQPLHEAAAFLDSLEENFGRPGGQGLSLRIGRAAFRYGLKHLGAQAGFQTMEFRLLPPSRRLETGLNVLARLLHEAFGDRIAVTDDGSHWLWHAEGGVLCRGDSAGPNSCYLMTGILQEFMTWAGGGRVYRVVEAECRASGSRACIFRIEKKPLD